MGRKAEAVHVDQLKKAVSCLICCASVMAERCKPSRVSGVTKCGEEFTVVKHELIECFRLRG